VCEREHPSQCGSGNPPPTAHPPAAHPLSFPSLAFSLSFASVSLRLSLLLLWACVTRGNRYCDKCDATYSPVHTTLPSSFLSCCSLSSYSLLFPFQKGDSPFLSLPPSLPPPSSVSLYLYSIYLSTTPKHNKLRIYLLQQIQGGPSGANMSRVVY